jgi:two-component system, NarL family, response regulator DesR
MFDTTPTHRHRQPPSTTRHTCDRDTVTPATPCNTPPVRPTRAIYVENDPALRGIISTFLAQRPEIDLILTAPNADDVVDSPEALQADVALLDLALGVHEMNGIDLGIALRERNSDIGIVIHSQHPLTHLARRVPKDLRIGWSFMPKTGDMNMDDLVAVMRTTARGIAVGDMTSPAAEDAAGVLEALTPRQRAVMALAATGLSAPQVAARLGISHDSVRQDLSKAYRQLVPDAGPGDDLRTRAILTYLQLVRDQAWDD